MTVERSQRARNAAIIADSAVTILGFLVAFRIWDAFRRDDPLDFLSHAALLPLILAIWFLFLSRFGAYRNPAECNRIGYAYAVVQAVGAGLALLIALLFLFKIQYVSRAVMVIFAGLDIVLLLAVRHVLVWHYYRSRRNGGEHLKVLVVGTGRRARRLSKTLREHTVWGVHIVGYLDLDANLVGESIGGSDVVGVVDDISAILKANVIDEVILAIPRAMISDVEKIAYACDEEGVRFRIMADVFNVQVPRMEVVYFGSLPLLTLHPVVQEEWKVLVKRAVDLAITILLLPAVLAVTAAVAVAIRLDTKGPVFFVQERVGLNKRLFRMYKFRTMVVGSEKMMREVEGKNEAEGPIFKIADDPRITRVGKLLRRSSLDELPQVFNVLRGDMSLVGPRPMSVRDVNLFDKGIQRKRFSVKPGITCLWQVSGRSLLPFSRWLELDLYYISNWSLGLDFKILWKTIPAVLRGTGAM